MILQFPFQQRSCQHKAAIAQDRKQTLFVSVLEAKLALSNDGLGCVYRDKNTVYVVTVFGSGKFPAWRWDQ